jgi:spore germination cell wall hydrolase CwlJ-like protein
MKLSVKTIHLILGILFVTFLLNLIITFKFDNLKEKIYFKNKSYVTAENVDKTLDCLAMNIYEEAANESFEGKVAVAQITLNRVDHPKFPKEVCKVVTEKTVVMEKVVCQFSWYCVHKFKKPNNSQYEESYKVAKKVLLEGFRLESLKDAIYYHAVYVKPNWPYQKVTQIGNHVFYRERK